MTYSLQNNQVIFKKGYKPIALKDAQRVVCETYMIMAKARSPRVPSVAQAIFLKDMIGDLLPTLLSTTPWYLNAVSAASRAYAATNGTLFGKKLYSMNLTFPVSDLDQLKGLPAELVTALRESSLSEVTFMAREL